ADLAGTEGLAPGEKSRIGHGQPSSAARAGPPRRIQAVGLVERGDDERAAAEIERRPNRRAQAGHSSRPVMDVGDHRLNLVQTVAIEVRDLSDPVELAIDAHLMQAALGYGGNNIAVMTLALANERREYDERLFGEIKCDPFRQSSRIGRFPGDGAF